MVVVVKVVSRSGPKASPQYEEKETQIRWALTGVHDTTTTTTTAQHHIIRNQWTIIMESPRIRLENGTKME